MVRRREGTSAGYVEDDEPEDTQDGEQEEPEPEPEPDPEPDRGQTTRDPLEGGTDTGGTSQPEPTEPEPSDPETEPEPEPEQSEPQPEPEPEPEPSPPSGDGPTRRPRPDEPPTTPTSDDEPDQPDDGRPPEDTDRTAEGPAKEEQLKPGEREPEEPTQTVEPKQEGPTPTGQGAEKSGSDQFIIRDEQLSEAEAEQRLKRELAQQQEDLEAEDIQVGINEQVATVELSEEGAQEFEGDAGKELSTFTVPTVQSAARGVEARVVANQDVSAKDVAVLPTDEGFTVQFTKTALAERAAEQVQEEFSLSDEDITIQDGEIQIIGKGAPEKKIPGARRLRAEKAQQAVEEAPIEPELEGIQNRISDVQNRFAEQQFQPDIDAEEEPRSQIEKELEQQVGVDLDPDKDIKFTTETQDGKTIVTGELTRSGEKRIEQETAFDGVPQDTPAEGIAEYLAGIKYEYEEARENFREGFYSNVPSLEKEFEETVPDYSDEFDETVPDLSDEFDSVVGGGGLAGAAAVGVAAPEPTTTAGGALILGGIFAGSVTADALLRGKGEDLDAQAQASATELEIPEGGEQFVQDEVTTPTRPGLFESELAIPDPQQQTFSGVPEQGVEIDVEDQPQVAQATELDIPTEEGETQQFPSELNIPEQEAPTIDEPRATPQQQQTGRQTGKQPTERSIGQEDTGSDLPQEFIPDDEVLIGRDYGGSLVVNYPDSQRIGDVVFPGRTPSPEEELPRPEEEFLGFDREAIQRVEQAETPQARVQDTAIPRQALAQFPLVGTEASAQQQSRLAEAQRAEARLDAKERLDVAPDTALDISTKPAAAQDAQLAQEAALDQIGLAEQQAPGFGLGEPPAFAEETSVGFSEGFGTGVGIGVASPQSEPKLRLPYDIGGDDKKEEPPFQFEAAVTETGILDIEDVIDNEPGGL